MANDLTTEQLFAIQKMRYEAEGKNLTWDALRPKGENIRSWMGGVSQVDTTTFIIGAEAETEPWEWLINSPYQVKMHNKVRVEFLDPAGAVAFKLMFWKSSK
jgi:hypothetical protein